MKPPTVWEFAQHFGGAYVSTEGALWRTLGLLFVKPGELTRLYLAGRRKHYVLPLRLYLTISVRLLLLMRLVTGAAPVQVDLGNGSAAPTTGRNIELNLGLGRAARKDGGFQCEQLPDWACRRIRERVAVAPQDASRALTDFRDRFMGNLGAAMFVLMPAFALWLKLAYWNRRMRYVEHLVFALHVHAFWFFALALTLPDWGWLSGCVMVAVPWYTFAAMKRVYGGRRGPRLARGLVVMALYAATLIAALSGLALWTLLA